MRNGGCPSGNEWRDTSRKVTAGFVAALLIQLVVAVAAQRSTPWARACSPSAFDPITLADEVAGVLRWGVD